MDTLPNAAKLRLASIHQADASTSCHCRSQVRAAGIHGWAFKCNLLIDQRVLTPDVIQPVDENKKALALCGIGLAASSNPFTQIFCLIA